MKIEKSSSVAVVLPPSVGGSFVGMVFVSNFVRNVCTQPVFGRVAEHLADSFAYGAPSNSGEVAKWTAMCGRFVGNDSAPGRLTSSIGAPKLALFMRRRLARSWRPGWGLSKFVSPLNVVPFGRLKERLRKQLVSVRRGMSGFQTLRNAQAAAIVR